MGNSFIMVNQLLDLPIGYAFALLGFIAIFLNHGNKRWICLFYVAGLCLEEVVYQIYIYADILEDYWESYYQCLSLVDFGTVLAMYYFLHPDYKPILYLLCLMVAVNVIVFVEPLVTGTVFVWEMRVQTLENLNYAVLLIMFGRSHGFSRIMDKLFAGSLEKSVVRLFRPSNTLLYMGNREENSPMEKKSCTTQ